MSTECKNHPNVPAVDRCAGCAEPFCSNCLVEVHGQKYCAACKVMALQGANVVLPDVATIPCKEANEALICAIIGIFCLGIILEPVAIAKALAAKKAIAANPQLSGAGKAQAALIIACIGLVLWVLGVVSKISSIH